MNCRFSVEILHSLTEHEKVSAHVAARAALKNAVQKYCSMTDMSPPMKPESAKQLSKHKPPQ
jgi:hypothetical protein